MAGLSDCGVVGGVNPSTSSPISSIASYADGGMDVAVCPMSTPEQPERPRDVASLYRATLAPLRRYLGRMLGNAEEAKDVAQDAYVRVQSASRRESVENPQALLFVTARRLAINRLRDRDREPLASAAMDFGAAEGGDVRRQVMARQELELMAAAIDALPAGCREVLLLRKVDLLSHREIAERLGIAISSVEKHHARALRLLRAALPADVGGWTKAETTPEKEGSL